VDVHLGRGIDGNPAGLDGVGGYMNNKKNGLDAARYRRLAWLIEFGCWSVGHHEIKDSYGLTNDTFMDNKADMDTWLDKPEVIADADACAKAL